MPQATNIRATEAYKLPTNTTTRRHAVHRWANITAGFAPEFVYECIERDNLKPGDVVLDPFTGMATTQVASNFLGLDALGYEPQPHFWAMAVAKTSTRDPGTPERLSAILRDLTPVKDLTEIWNKPQLEYLTKLVPTDQLALLGQCVKLLSKVDSRDQFAYRLVVSKLLEWACGSSTDGIYKAPSTKKHSHNVIDRVPEILSMLTLDIAEMPSSLGNSTIYQKSSTLMEEVDSNSVDLIVTSPPYMNNFDFAEMARMELYFWGLAADWGEITEKVRSQLVVNTTTVPSRFKRDQEQWEVNIPAPVAGEIEFLRDSLIRARQAKKGKKDYEKLLKPYFSQMSQILRECHRVLKKGGNLDLVVADAALYGVHIPTEAILGEIMVAHGFTGVEILRLRNRGTRWILAKREGSPLGLGEFHVKARKDNDAETR